MRKRLAGIALAMALVMGIQGCYGSFGLVRKVWKWNGSLGNKFVNELVFLVMYIVPVYGIAGLIDVVILNSVEFWTGKNPVLSKVITQGDKQVALNYDKSTDLVKISYFEKGQLKSEGFLKRTDKGVEMLSADGSKTQLIASTDANGMVSVADASGKVLAQSLN